MLNERKNEVKQKLGNIIKDYYNSYIELYDGKPVPYKIIIWNNGTLEDATFRMKKEFDNKYYFVVKLRNGNYAIAQIGWKNGIISGIILTDKEFEDNKEVFKEEDYSGIVAYLEWLEELAAIVNQNLIDFSLRYFNAELTS